MHGTVVYGDNLSVLEQTEDNTVDLIYVDPPFNTGNIQILHSRTKGTSYQYSDIHTDFLEYIGIRAQHFRRVLKDTGTLYFHIDYREVHYCKILLDSIFGRSNFLNEVIWAYDYGARQRNKWPTKHDNILVYVKSKHYYFNTDEIERIPYMAPGLVGPDKVDRGKLPTDTWWHTIVPTNGRERTGYPTQKPVGILKRIISASCLPNGLVADYFAGSGTTGVACILLDRSFLLVDNNPQAIEVMRQRFKGVRFTDATS